MIVVVMGVCGCGKSSVGQRIAARLGWRFIEGDDLHPEANRAKMASGTPLTDEDRWPWLDRIAAETRKIDAAGGSVVVACSALRQVYRDRLRQDGKHVRFLHLTGDVAVIRERMSRRKGHYMPLGLLDSQLATLEPAGPGEALQEIDVAQSIEEMTDAGIQALAGEPVRPGDSG